MQAFQYCVPTQVIFGRGAGAQAGQAVRAAGGSRVLVLYGGGSAVKSGLLDRVTASLAEAGLTYITKGGVKPNPVLSFVEETAGEMRGKDIDFLLAVGGGSVIDAAKAIGLALADPQGRVWDLFTGARDPQGSVPVGSVLTIAAAGSETSDSTVVTNELTHEKRGRNAPFNRPKFAIMDPEVTYTLPPRQTACGVADILMHTMDRYFSSIQGNETTDALAEAILRTTMKFGLIALTHPDDYEARSEIMWCGSLSHNDLTGLGRGKDFTVHQLGHELSGVYDIPHGESLAIMWPAWARFVWRTDPARFARFARNVFGIVESDDERAALAGIDAAERFFQDLGLPTTLGASEIGVLDGGALEMLANGCSRGRSRTVGNFRPIDHGDMLEIYRAANR